MSKNMRLPNLFRFSLLFLLIWIPTQASAGTSGLTNTLPEIPATVQLAAALPTAGDALEFSALVAGSRHTCALTTGGGVKCWGYNYYGQLGDGTTTDSSAPVDVSGLSSGVSALAAGGWHTCAVTTSGEVKCWGGNVYGQLGNSTTTNSTTPVDVSGLSSGVSALVTGGNHTCAVNTGGGVKCWGNNEYGQLGDGTTTDSSAPVDVSGLSSGVSALAAGWFHTCALTTGGGVKCWGDNEAGQLGDGTTTNSSTPVDVSSLSSGVSALAAGYFHSCAVTTGGGAKCWGSNGYGRLGDGTTTSSSVPVDVGGLSSGVSVLAAGDGHTCAVTTGGGVKCWGYNRDGQLGNGTTTNSSMPVNVSGLSSGVGAMAAGGNHTCIVTTTGEIKCWGDNAAVQLGDGTILQRSVPVDVSGLSSGVSVLTAGDDHTCAVTADGEVKCWGYNRASQLGNGTTVDSSVPVQVSGLSSGISVLAAGANHTCAVTTGGGVKCWGDNWAGQLGNGTTTDSSVPVEVSGLSSGISGLAAGAYHTCAITTSGGAKCWGANWSGQLGNGTTTDSSVPMDVSELSTGVNVLEGGDFHTCALITGGSVKCWGNNTYGQLGNGTTASSSVPVDVSGLSSGVSALATGGNHTCAVTMGGGVKCWGDNEAGQLGDGTPIDRSIPVDVSGLSSGASGLAAGYRHTCALTMVGVKCWGYNWTGQLGDGTIFPRYVPVTVVGLSSGVSALSGGYSHTCALTTDGRAKCWGRDGDGQLGIGTNIYSPTPLDIIEQIEASLTLNYPDGQPGSFFTLTGWNFPENTQATLSINGQVITTTLAVNPTGSFIVFLDSTGAQPGNYQVTVSVNPSAAINFTLDNSVPLRSQEGGGQVFMVPQGIVYDHFVYLPLVIK